MRRACHLLALLGALALGGCGDDPKLDTEKLEADIAAGIEKQTGTGAVTVDCPDEIEQEEGLETECEVTAPGGVTATVVTTQTDDDGNADWKLDRP